MGEIKKREKYKVIKRAKYKYRYVITIPAMWNTLARETMAKAAIEANIVKEEDLKNLLIITEPKAAALYCENCYEKFVKSDNLQFIVCDAGGGTVDLVTFRFVADQAASEATERKFVIRQVGDGIGDICGSTYLDANFRDYILQFYRDIGVKEADLNTIVLDEVMKDFIIKKKPAFGTEDSKKFPIVVNLPARPEITNDHSKKAENKHYKLGPINKALIIPYGVMEAKVFDPVMTRAEDFIEKQIKKLEDGKINTILLVGGFSQSKYLQDRVNKKFKSDPFNITVGFPPEGITAISYGAVSYAQNPRMISRKVASQSLALEVQATYDQSKCDPLDKKVTGATGGKFTKSRLEYFVKKKDTLTDDGTAVYEKVVYIEYPRNVVIAIFSCDSDQVDKDDKWRFVNDQHIKVMEMNIDMPLLPTTNLEEGDKIKFLVTLVFNHIGITVTVNCQDKEIKRQIEDAPDKPCLQFVNRSSPMVLRSKRPPAQFTLAYLGYLFNSSRSS